MFRFVNDLGITAAGFSDRRSRSKMILALDDFFTNFNYFARWVHIISGITWIGILYFFNFINGPFQKGLAGDLKPNVNPGLLGRSLWWFRWGAMFTFLFGVTLLMHKYQVGDLWTDADGSLTGRTKWILFGAFFGTIMWFNVWFIIWPAQKKILTGLKTGNPAPDAAALAARAGLFSKINTYFSAPMLFGMIGPNNYGAFSWGMAIFVAVLGFGIIRGLYGMSAKVGKEFLNA